MDEQLWSKISEAVQIIAKNKNIDVPANLLEVSGDVFERNFLRTNALMDFCKKAQIETKSFYPVTGFDIQLASSHFDEIALKYLDVNKKVEKPVVSLSTDDEQPYINKKK